VSTAQVVHDSGVTQIDQLCINTIRTLSMDAVQQANSGHTGTPMALAPPVYTTWNRVMQFDPKDPIWTNRDRSVLSNGHAAKANEVVEAYRYILQLRHKPAALVLSRQPLPTLDRTKYAAASDLSRGACVLADAPGGDPELILIGSGSEVTLAVNTHESLLAESIRSRVVSMPSWDIFDGQSQDYRDSVLPPTVKRRIAIEQASTSGWERYAGDSGKIIGMKTFGASAPLKELPRKFGFEPEQAVAAAKELLGRA
jgi:transketolase